MSSRCAAYGSWTLRNDHSVEFLVTILYPDETARELELGLDERTPKIQAVGEQDGIFLAPSPRPRAWSRRALPDG